MYRVIRTQEVKVTQRRGKLGEEEDEGKKKSYERWKCKAERKRGKRAIRVMAEIQEGRLD